MQLAIENFVQLMMSKIKGEASELIEIPKQESMGKLEEE